MNTLRVLQQSCGSLVCLAAVVRLSENAKKIAKKMNILKFRCDRLATLFFVRQSCGVVHNTLRLPYETKKFVVAVRCTAAARLM